LLGCSVRMTSGVHGSAGRDLATNTTTSALSVAVTTTPRRPARLRPARRRQLSDPTQSPWLARLSEDPEYGRDDGRGEKQRQWRLGNARLHETSVCPGLRSPGAKDRPDHRGNQDDEKHDEHCRRDSGPEGRWHRPESATWPVFTKGRDREMTKSSAFVRAVFVRGSGSIPASDPSSRRSTGYSWTYHA
jgi:hypothetical protein